MVDVTYSDKAKQSGEDFALLQKASRKLEEIVDPSKGPVAARWDRIQDEKGRPKYELRLDHEYGTVTGDFTPAELPNPYSISFLLHSLWGRLTMLHLKKLVAALGE